MPTIRSFTNSDIDFYIFGASINTTSIAASGFNPAYTRSLIDCTSLTTEGARMYLTDQNHGGAARAAGRFQFGIYLNGSSFGSSFASFNPGNLIVLYDVATGRPVFRLGHKNINNNASTSTIYLQYNSNPTVGSTTWVDVGAGVLVSAGLSIHTLTWLISDTVGILTWHQEGALMASLTGGDTKFTTSTTIDMIQLWGIGNTGTGGYQVRYGYFQLTDENYMTYGLTPVDIVLNGAGTNSGQTSGTTADVNEAVNNTATGKTFDTNGQTSTDTVVAMSGTLSGSPVMAVRQASNLRRGASGPQNMKHAIQQVAGLDLATINAINGIGFTTVADIWLLNPRTGLPWTIAGINGSEFGMQAVT